MLSSEVCFSLFSLGGLFGQLPLIVTQQLTAVFASFFHSIGSMHRHFVEQFVRQVYARALAATLGLLSESVSSMLAVSAGCYCLLFVC
ncbi:hypothetical protein EON64_07980 [archaeon]|nr:MAG: hypothetical protein EON64_07980 [archaeon]